MKFVKSLKKLENKWNTSAEFEKKRERLLSEPTSWAEYYQIIEPKKAERQGIISLAEKNENNGGQKDDWSPKIKFSKFYGKVGVIFWILFHLNGKSYVLYWYFDLKSWFVDFFMCFTWEKTPQNNFSSQNFVVENNYVFISGQTLENCDDFFKVP